jgi:hypothetical protein
LALAAILYGGQSNFEFEYLGEFVTEFENILSYESGTQMGLNDEKKSEVENLVLLSLKVTLLTVPEKRKYINKDYKRQFARFLFILYFVQENAVFCVFIIYIEYENQSRMKVVYSIRITE